ncbi:MAG: YggT family protein [Bacilli bacterium]|nr:YggT family protein [Bacilli bacterium]
MFNTVIYIFLILARLYQAVLAVTIILTWIPRSSNYAAFRMISNIGGWYLDVFRGKLIFGGFDFGTIVGLIVYEFILGFSFVL